MKKRVLSLLLLLSMLVTMVPAMALGGTAVENEEVPRSETFTDVGDFYSLYKTEGLVAFFDALTASNGTVDLAEGKWYARVYDEDSGTFVTSSEIYATLTGGAYDAEGNPTGWRFDGAGLGYADPTCAAMGNSLTIGAKDILYTKVGDFAYRKANWTIETAIKTTLRQNAVAEGETVGEALGAYRFGPIYAWRATNLFGKNTAGEGEGATRWCVSATLGAPWDGAMQNGSTVLSDSFVVNDGRLTSLVAEKRTATDRSVTYTLTHGNAVMTDSLRADTVADSDIVLLGGEQGSVYSLRIYVTGSGEPITATERTVNSSVDTLIRLGVSVDKFNEMSDALKDTFLLKELPSLTVTTKAEAEKAIDDYIAEMAAREIARQQNMYDSLYVGADGSKTANGGTLVSLFTSYAGDTSALVADGIWLNKMRGGIDATMGGSRYWYKNETGGVGFRIFAGMVYDDGGFSTDSPYNTIARYHGSTTGLNIRLQLGLDMLPDEDYTVEWVANYKHIESVNEKGESVGDMLAAYIAANPGKTNSPYNSHEYLAPIDVIGGVASWTTHLAGYFSGGTLRGATAWGLAENIRWDASGSKHGHAGNLISRSGAFAVQNEVHSYALSLDEDHFEDKNGTAQIDANFHLWKDASSYDIKTMSTVNAQENKSDKYYDLGDDFGDFYLSASLPTEFYAVRVYSAALTAEEMRWNRFVDLAAYAGASLNAFNALDAATQASVLKSMAVQPFTDEEGFNTMLAEIVALYENIVKAEDTLYVQDGLTLLTTAYKNLHTGAVGEDVITWLNAVDSDRNISIRGGMELRADGGYYKMQTLEQWEAGHNYGYYVDNSLLPDGDYTLELVMNPAGIMTYDADGVASRYVDEITQHGVYDRNHQLGFAIGPLRALAFVAARPEGQSGLHNRWMYNKGNYCWDNVPYVDGVAQRNLIMTDSWNDNTTFEKIVTFDILYDRDENDVQDTFELYTDFVMTNTATWNATKRFTNAEANNYFQLMVGVPGGMFSVRLYNRVLTEAERQQNRAADLIYHYGLDTTLLNKVLEIFADDTTKVYRGLVDMSFNLDKEDAQRVFDSRLSALWLSCADFAIRGNNKDGIRFYFDMDEDSATKMLANGYKIEIGALVNVGQNARPTLDGHNYDYKVLAYDGIGGKNEGFFIDEDTFAVTLLARGSNSFSYLQSIKIQGYIDLTTPEGEHLIFYIEPSFEDTSTETFFDIYEYAQIAPGYATQIDLINYLSECTFKCYEKHYVYVKADAPDGGNGTKDAPYNDFVKAMAGVKEQLQAINSPTHFIVQLDDGVYEVHELITFGIEDMPYPFCRFQLTSKNNKSTLTSNRVIDNSGFVSAGENLWKYQFAADADGNYPFFRNLYANGQIATMAHNGALSYHSTETEYFQRLERVVEGAFSNASTLYKNGTLRPDTLFYPLGNVEMNTRFAYYRDMFCAYEELRKMPAGTLTLSTETAVADPTDVYLEWFDYFRDYWIIYHELDAAYKNPEIGNNTRPQAIAKMKDLTTKTEGADADFHLLFTKQLEAFLGALEKGNITNARTAISPPLLTAAINAPFSSGVYAKVMEMLTAGTLDYTAPVKESEKNLAQGVQFLYYRDALLALRDVKALGDDPDVNAQPNAAGSEQYKALFTSYLYDTAAAAELKAMRAALEAEENGSITWKSALAQATTVKADAPAAYAKAFVALRNSYAIKDFAGLSTFAVVVDESTGPYNGNVPTYDSISQAKLYMKEGIAGEFLKNTVADALARMEADAAALVAEAEAAYLAAYNALTDALVAHKELLLAKKNTEASAYNTNTLVPARTAATKAYDAYLAAQELAAKYVSPDTADRYNLKDTDIESRLIFMWNFNIPHVMGIDYDDRLVSWDGENNVAVYFDPEHWASMIVSSEWYIQNRVSNLQNAPEFLDTEGEYYYNTKTGELYYYTEDIDAVSFEYPTLENMIYLANAKKITITNLAFTGMDDTTISTRGYFGGQAGKDEINVNFLGQVDHFPSRAPIYVWHADGLNIVDCTFHDLACDAVTMRGRVANSNIDSNVFERIGAAAFRSVGKPNLPASFTDQSGSENVNFTNNYVNEVAQDLYNSIAVQFAYSKDVTISYNTISNCSYTGISVGWNWSYSGSAYGKNVKLMHVDISHNYIFSFMQQMGDGGAIYTLGGNANVDHPTPFNWSHDNYIVFTNKTGDGINSGSVIGNYHDGGSSHWSTYNNVIVAHSYGSGSPNGVYKEAMTEAKFKELNPDTHLTWQEYGKRMAMRGTAMCPTFTQDWVGDNGSTDAHALRIYYDNNYLVNSRATVEGSDRNQDDTTRHYEMFVGSICPGAPFYSETKNTHYVKNPAYLPASAENIIYEAGCDRMKGDPIAIAENNY